MQQPRMKLKYVSRFAAVFALLFLASAGRAQSDKPVQTPKPIGPPLEVAVPEAPRAFQAADKWHLVYELHLANLGRWECQLVKVEVLGGPGRGKPPAGYEGKELEAMIWHPSKEAGEKTKIAAGAVAIVYVWMNFETPEEVPAMIEHRVVVKIGDYPEAITLEGVAATVDKDPVAVIAAPLRGADWVAANGPSNTSQHRRALVPINGRAQIAQRYAIDWVQAYPDGKTYRGDAKDNRSYRAYGAEIHAVADGIVTQTKDGIQQNIPNEMPIVPMTLETLGGNRVIVEIGKGLYAFYAHLQPGSLRVKAGDKVRRGDVLGLLGNSGNSTEPHLHFQLCDGNSELGSEGVPYAFASFELEGTAVEGKPLPEGGVTRKREMEMPAEDEVVRFINP